MGNAIIGAAALLLGLVVGKYLDRAGERRRWLREQQFDAYVDLLGMVHAADLPLAEQLSGQQQRAIVGRVELLTSDAKIPYGVMDLLVRGQPIDAAAESALVDRIRAELGVRALVRSQAKLKR